VELRLSHADFCKWLTAHRGRFYHPEQFQATLPLRTRPLSRLSDVLRMVAARRRVYPWHLLTETDLG